MYDNFIMHLREFEYKKVGVMVICSFFGHKDTPQLFYPMLKETIEKLIVHRNVVNFMVGNQGSFDGMVIKALRELKQSYSHICYNVILAYLPVKKQEYELYSYTETLLPLGIEKVPKRFAILWRNKWMVRESQIVVCYVEHDWGGAAKCVEYASKQGREIINLAKII